MALAGVRDDQRHLAVGDQVAHAQRDGRVHDADQGGHLVLLEQLLGRGHAGVGAAALVGHHHLDGAPAELAALGLQVHAEAVLHVPAERRVHARLGDQQPHLDRPVGGAQLVLLQARPAAGARARAGRRRLLAGVGGRGHAMGPPVQGSGAALDQPVSRWDDTVRRFPATSPTRPGGQRMAVTAEVDDRVGWIALDRPPENRYGLRPSWTRWTAASARSPRPRLRWR